MARLPSLIAAAVLAVGASAGAAQVATPRPVASFVEGARACASVPAAIEEAERQLVSQGWPRATLQTGNGPAPNPNLRSFGRNGVLLMLPPPRADAPAGAGVGCAVYGSVEQMIAFTTLVEALSAALGSPPRQTRDTAALWLLEGPRAAQLERAAGQPRALMIFGSPAARPAQ